MFNDTICAESCISFTDLSSGNPTSWSWVFQGGTPPTSANQNPSNICFQDPGTYTINLSAGNGSGTGAVNKIITVQPKPIFTQQPLSASAAIGSQHRFTVALSASGNQFQWQSNQGAGFVNLMNGGQYSGVNNDTLAISNLSAGNQNQSFRCVASNSSNCYDTSEVAVLNVVNNTGMQELLDAGVALSPNPASNQLVLEMKKMPAKQYQIYDLSGRMILQGSIQQNKTIIPVSDLIPGSYLLRIPEIPYGAWPFIKD
jgi:PKD repeat protein